MAMLLQANIDIANECMDLTCDLVSRFGPTMTPENHVNLLKALKPESAHSAQQALTALTTAPQACAIVWLSTRTGCTLLRASTDSMPHIQP